MKRTGQKTADHTQSREKLVFTASGIRALDADLAALDLLELTMEHAGARAAEVLSARFASGRVLVLAGPGANGGDGFVAARHLHAAGHPVEVLALDGRHDLARRMRARLEPLLAVRDLTPDALRAALANANVVFDALLGTGVTPPLRGALPDIVTQLNASGQTVVSLDLPSGLPADTVENGEGDEAFVRADLTLALVGLKPALLFHDVGELAVLPLGVPPELLARHARATVTSRARVRELLPVRPRGAHKGSAGRVFVLGGQSGYTGAPVMTALGALRAGAGLVMLYSGTELPGHPPEAMAHVLREWSEVRDLPRPDAAAVGMGLRQDGERVAREVLAWGVPTVLDADALQPALRGAGHAGVVWTPHPGEAARLLGTSTRAVTRDPLGVAQTLRCEYGGTVVLKGGPSVIATGEGLRVCPFGNPGMATGGSGDVLSGVIAALLGQGLGPAAAAEAGVALHALAGDRAYRRHGYGLIATDIAAEVGAAWLELARDDPDRTLQ